MLLWLLFFLERPHLLPVEAGSPTCPSALFSGFGPLCEIILSVCRHNWGVISGLLPCFLPCLTMGWTHWFQWPFSSSVQLSHSVMSDSLRPHEPQHARPPCPSPTPRVHPNPCPLSWWYHPTISSSVIPFSSCPQSFPASGSFPMSQLFASHGQSIGISASTSVLPMNTQDWSPLGWTGWISLQSKGLSSIFSSTTVQKHQFFSTQLSSWSNSHIHTWLLEKPQPWLDGPLLAKFLPLLA